MALTNEQRQQLNSMLNHMSQAEINSKLSSYDNMQRWLYNEHYEFYLRVKDKLRDVWDEVKRLALKVLEGAAIAVAVPVYIAAQVVATPFRILGKILDL